MREQICSPGLFDLDELKSRVKIPSLSKFGISDPGLCVCFEAIHNFNNLANFSARLLDFERIFIYCTYFLKQYSKEYQKSIEKAQCLLHRMLPEELVPGRIRSIANVQEVAP
jgi:hypothetical protein